MNTLAIIYVIILCCLLSGNPLNVYIAIICVGSGLIFLACGMFIRHLLVKLKMQRDTLRRLTENEIALFLEGNRGGQYESCVSNEYRMIEALPYDLSFEIEMEKLLIGWLHKEAF